MSRERTAAYFERHRKRMVPGRPQEWWDAYLNEPLWHFDHIVTRGELKAEMPNLSAGSPHPDGFNPLEEGRYEYAVEMMTVVEWHAEVERIATLLAWLADPMTPDEAAAMMATMRGWGLPVVDILKTGEYVLAEREEGEA